MIQKQYVDFGPTLAHEKLTEVHELELSVESVRQLMIAAELWKPRRAKRPVVHQMRVRRAHLGELVQLDGSPHDWFEGRALACTLLVFIDDATGRLLELYFTPQESMFSYCEAVRRYVTRHGKQLAFYSDKHGIFRANMKNAVSGSGLTQFGRAMQELDIQIICANSPQPETEWVTGPNQLWDWDITWLRTPQRYEFLYLYSLLDHFSRKTVAWLASAVLRSDEAQTLWDRGLVNEGLLDQPRDHWPKSLSDRGAQMRSHSTRQYFHKLGIDQLFSRPRHPNDNPRVEAHFGTVKTHPVYPGYFADVPVAVNYFTGFYDWYNNVHPLTTLNMLTPKQVHSGPAAALLAALEAQKV